MIISHKHKFIFIKTIKTAGTSIELFLHPHCGPSDVITRFNAPSDIDEENARFQNESFRFSKLKKIQLKLSENGRRTLKKHHNHQQMFYPHMTAWEIKQAVGDKVWDEYYKFCVVRNPYEKTISHYFFRNQRLQLNQTFDEYLEAGVFGLNAPLYCDWNSGDVMVDEVIRFEELNTGLAGVFGKLNIPFGGTLDIFKKGQFRKERTSYESYLNSVQKGKIREIHSREFELFGY